MYSHVITLKTMFAEFFPAFKAGVVRDDEAWRIADPNDMFWADNALNLKRSGDYVGSCRLYFDQILRRRAVTQGWAAGIFKTLACSGDIGDAVNFGFEWANRFAERDPSGSDTVVMHLSIVVALIKHPESAPISFPEYLKEISGNPDYTVDMKQTDLYTNIMLRDLKKG